jgi:lipoyl synthase
VVTSVTRDDLPDGGAGHFAAVIRAIRAASPGTRVEALIPDFGGDATALETVLEAAPDVLNHNLETTESLYPGIHRPRENDRRSLGVLTKSGLMIGLGESETDIVQTFADLRQAGCDLLTVGQYLQPTAAHPPVARYYTPEEFQAFAAAARRAGFLEVVSAPLVRSSYEAGRLYDAVRKKDGVPCVT